MDSMDKTALRVPIPSSPALNLQRQASPPPSVLRINPPNPALADESEQSCPLEYESSPASPSFHSSTALHINLSYTSAITSYPPCISRRLSLSAEYKEQRSPSLHSRLDVARSRPSTCPYQVNILYRKKQLPKDTLPTTTASQSYKPAALYSPWPTPKPPTTTTSTSR